MKAKCIITILAIVGLLVLSAVSVLGGSRGKVASAPRLFFSDLTDGPISGWEGSNTKGAAVSIWGLNFGTSRGSGYVTCGGVDLKNSSDYAEWGVINEPATAQDSVDGYTSARKLERITFWLNSSMNTGDGYITVVTTDGRDSVPFHCRALGSNHIYFTSPTGNNSWNGLYDTAQGGSNGPWKTVYKARQTVQAGDVVYYREGLYTTGDVDYSVTMLYLENNHNNGQWNKSIALASYPGEFAQWGNASKYTVIHRYSADKLYHWTFSKLMWRADWILQWLDTSPPITSEDRNVRMIGLDVHTPAGGFGEGLDFGTDLQESLFVYGCHIHDMLHNSRGSPTSQAYGMYFMGYGVARWIYVGWNEICHQNPGLAITVFGHGVGGDEYIENLYIHDNFIHDNTELGINVGGGDGRSTYEFVRSVWVYNNIFVNNGGIRDGAIRVKGDLPGASKGEYYFYGNTFYNNSMSCIHLWDAWGDPVDACEIKNNIFYARSGQACISDAWTQGSKNVTVLSNNCYYNGTSPPAWDSYAIEANPQFSKPGSWNFYLQETSPCIDSGAIVSVATADYEGISRPQGSAYDIGAYEVLADLPPDTIPPVISNVACSDTTDSSTTITWMTNEYSTSQVEYGTTLDYGSSTPLNSNLVKNHTQTLNGLKSSTKYYYRVKSKDASDNLAVSDPDSLITKAGQPGRPRWW